MSLRRCASIIVMIIFIVHSGIFLAFTSDSTDGARLQCRGKIICPVALRTRTKSNTTTLTHTQTQTNFSGILARSFEPWKNPLPCFETDDKWASNDVRNSPADTGFLYIKPFKTGSSTTSGINLRIARNVARRLGKSYPICRGESAHRNLLFGEWR